MPAAAALVPAILASGKSLPSNRVRIGLIGRGGRGRELLNVFRQFPEVDVAAISNEGKRPPVELEQSQQATVCCHLANIAYRTGRKLRWDGDREAIIGDGEAAQLLNRPRRKGYELPTG
jgi:hypothetical protein